MPRRQRSIPHLADKLERLVALRSKQFDLDLTHAGITHALSTAGVELGPDTIRQIRSGYNKNPGTDILTALADLFQVPLSYWFAPAVEARVLSEDPDGPLRPGDTARVLSQIDELSPSALASLLLKLDKGELD